MKNYKPRDILIPLFVSLFIFLMLFFYIFPTVSNIFTKKDIAGIYDANVKTYDINLSRLSILNANALDTAFSSVQNQIPIDTNIASLVDQTIKLAQSFNLTANTNNDVIKSKDANKTPQAVSIKDLQSGDPENVSKNILINNIAYPINFALTVRGNENSILQFLDRLSQQNRIMKLMSINLTSNGSNIQDWSSNLILFSYAIYKPNLNSSVNINKITNPTDSLLKIKPILLTTQY